MFDAIKVSPATMATAGTLAVGSGIALYAYRATTERRPRAVLPLALGVGGVALRVLANQDSAARHTVVSGPQEEAIHKEWQKEDEKLKILPWAIGGAALFIAIKIVLL